MILNNIFKYTNKSKSISTIKRLYSTTSTTTIIGGNNNLTNTIEIKNLPLNINTLDIWNQFKELKISSNNGSGGSGIKTIFDGNSESMNAIITFENEQDYSKALDKKVISFNEKNYNIKPTIVAPPSSNITYLNQSAVTKQLWKDREHKHINPQLKSVPSLTSKSPNDSKIEFDLFFSTDLALREQYLSPYGHLRVGRLLEDLDALAAAVGFKHAENECDGYKKIVVTASVDRIKLLQPLVVDKDLKMVGRVTWVGKSSMEIMIKVTSKDNKTQKWEPVLVAYFTMVAKDPMTGKSTPVNHLIINTPHEKKLFQDAEKHKLQRLNSHQQSLEKIPPTSQELQTIHNLFMISKKQSSSSSSSPKLDSSTNGSPPLELIPMNSTHIESVILCQPQEKNINGSIFGGYLMRKGFETAFTTCFMKFHESLPRFRGMDDIQFLTPVEIGDILTLESTIVYSQPIIDNNNNGGNNESSSPSSSSSSSSPQTYYAQVEVLAFVTNPTIGEKKLSNVFNFTFYCSPSKKQLEQQQQQQQQPNTTITSQKQIFAQSYADSMRFIQGKRIVDKSKLNDSDMIPITDDDLQ